MRRVLKIALATAAVGLAATAPASAATLVWQGITYDLTLDSITNAGLTGNFTLAISGINTASDQEGGRTGINAFAFTDPAVGDITSGTSAGFTWQLGGLNSSGCNTSDANFFCFANSGYTLPSGSSASIDFSITSSTTGSFDNWTPDFKIDWVGSQRNYDLVSQPIPVNAVPEPATWAMMLLGFSGIGMALRRSRRRSGALMQVA
jgi:hypothetical protein